MTIADLAAPEWHARASCSEIGGDLWFPEKGGSTREAKRVCMACEVRATCLQYALDNEEWFGIWGGLTNRERRKLLKASSQETTEDYEAAA